MSDPSEASKEAFDQLMRKRFAALFDACRKSHKGGPGGQAICVCGAGSGGSPACAALGMIRDFFRYCPTDRLPAEWREQAVRIHELLG